MATTKEAVIEALAQINYSISIDNFILDHRRVNTQLTIDEDGISSWDMNTKFNMKWTFESLVIKEIGKTTIVLQLSDNDRFHLSFYNHDDFA